MPLALGAARQDLHAVAGDQHGVLELRVEAAVHRHRRPTPRTACSPLTALALHGFSHATVVQQVLIQGLIVQAKSWSPSGTGREGKGRLDIVENLR
jgi:hypothetical protein